MLRLRQEQDTKTLTSNFQGWRLRVIREPPGFTLVAESNDSRRIHKASHVSLGYLMSFLLSLIEHYAQGTTIEDVSPVIHRIDMLNRMDSSVASANSTNQG